MYIKLRCEVVRENVRNTAQNEGGFAATDKVG